MDSQALTPEAARRQERRLGMSTLYRPPGSLIRRW